MVPQERMLAGHLTVAENVVLGIEPARGGMIRRSALREMAERALAEVTGDDRGIDLDRRADRLSVADQQLVEIARALCQASAAGREPKVLVLDEPTSSLGRADATRLFARVHDLEARGLAVVLVTHFLDDVRAHAHRFTVLRDGRTEAEGDPRRTEPVEIVRAMLGRELSGVAEARSSHAPGAVVLSAKGLGGREKPRAVDLELRAGEILGIAGLVGSGRTELLRVLMGLDPRTTGQTSLTAPRGMGLLSEDRGGEGLMLARSIGDNVVLSPRGPLLDPPSRARGEGARWIAELAIRAEGPDQPVFQLSGGNQQKVQVARLLREDYDVLLIDEPTRGIDVASKAQILELLRSLAKAGKAIVLVSSQLEELVATCDRIAVLARGELGAPRPVSEWTEETLFLEASS